jgi:hypothetical protein
LALTTAVRTGFRHRFDFHKRSQLFIGTHNDAVR